MRYVSAPNLNNVGGINGNSSQAARNSQLHPIPNSPTHDFQLNPKKPLHHELSSSSMRLPRPPQPPRAAKKFINT